MLIVVSLKLIPGIFGLFYHYASGKYSEKKVSDLSIFFIFGVETLPVIIFLLANLLLNFFIFTNLNPSGDIFLYIAIGLLISLCIAFFLFYFRRGRGTKTFISRKTAKNFDTRAKNIKTRSDAFILGFISGFPELIFTLPLYIIVLINISKNYIITNTVSFILLLFALSTVIPLFFLYAYFRNGNNLANFERLRIKNKTFFRIFIPLLYLLIAFLILIFEVIL